MTFFVSPKPQERHDSEGRNPLRKRRLKTRTEQRQQRRFFSMQICVSIATNERMRGYKYESLIENAKTKILSGLFIKEEERLNNWRNFSKRKSIFLAARIGWHQAKKGQRWSQDVVLGQSWGPGQSWELEGQSWVTKKTTVTKQAHYSQYFQTSLSKLLNSFIWGGRFSFLKSASKFAIKIIGPIKNNTNKKIYKHDEPWMKTARRLEYRVG